MISMDDTIDIYLSSPTSIFQRPSFRLIRFNEWLFMLTVSGLSKSYGGRALFEDASLQINRGDRIGLIGANGAGKSTLFSLILKNASPDTGSVAMERNATIGFLPQESAPSGEETVLELATNVSTEMEEVHRLLRDHPSDEDPIHHEAIARFDELDGHTV
jgi:ATP-binding cassette subfamily F protein 3